MHINTRKFGILFSRLYIHEDNSVVGLTLSIVDVFLQQNIDLDSLFLTTIITARSELVATAPESGELPTHTPNPSFP